MARLPKFVSDGDTYAVGGVLATVTVPTSGWLGTAPATISVPANGLKAGDDVFVTLDCPENYTQAQTAITEFEKIYKFACVVDDELKIWASSAVSSSISLKVW